MAMTHKQAVRELVTIVRDTVKDAGEEGVPNGLLYSIINRVLDYDAYMHLIDAFKSAGVFKERGNVLYYCDS